MKIKPLGRNIFIIPIDEMEKETTSGIILPESVEKAPPVKGQVAFIGPEVKDIASGDNILFRKYSPDSIEIDEEKYLVAEEDDILAILG